MRDFTRRHYLRLLLALAAVGMMTSAATAQRQVGAPIDYFLFGVNTAGNRSAADGRFGKARFVKVGRVFIIGTARGLVANRSQEPQVFINAGNIMQDPVTLAIRPSTIDQQVVQNTSARGSQTQLTMVFNPLLRR